MKHSFKIGDKVRLNGRDLRSSFYDSAHVYSMHLNPSKTFIIKELTNNGLDRWGSCDFFILEGEAINHPYDIFELADYINQCEFKKITAPDDLLEEANKRYPVGTKYQGVDSTNEHTVEEGWKAYWYDGYTLPEGKAIAMGKLKGLVYKGGKWAKIISQPKETPMKKKKFKVGDKVYVTCIGGNGVGESGERVLCTIVDFNKYFKHYETSGLLETDDVDYVVRRPDGGYRRVNSKVGNMELAEYGEIIQTNPPLEFKSIGGLDIPTEKTQLQKPRTLN